MTSEARCCSRHTNTCGHRGVCCLDCPTRRESIVRLVAVALLLVLVLTLLAVALPA